MNAHDKCVVKRLIRSRWDLPFVSADETGFPKYWDVEHKPGDCWHDGIERGIAYANALLELADFDPAEAMTVMQNVQSRMLPNGWGEETGFMQQIGRYAFAGRFVFGESVPADKDAEALWEKKIKAALPQDIATAGSVCVEGTP